MTRAFVTVVVPFEARHADAVDDRLHALGNRAGPALSDALDASAFVHFMSLTVVRDSPRDNAYLVLEAVADGHPRGVLAALAREIGPALRDVLRAAGKSLAEPELGDFLVRHNRRVGRGWFAIPGVMFDGTPGMTVGRIRREADLVRQIQQILDELPGGGSALDILNRVRARLFREGAPSWVFVADPVPLLAEAPRTRRFVPRILGSALRTLLWPLFVVPALMLVAQGLWAATLTLGAELVLGGIAAGLAYLRLRHKERTDVPEDSEPTADAVGEIMARENHGVQNHLAAVSTMKPGVLRRLALRLVLWIVGAFATYRSRPGTLSNMSTIHFARWILLPGTDKLLFFSHYTGSWESYLEDFIVHAHRGLTGVWSNTRGFPRTKNLVQEGATDADPFKRWARRQQQPTRCWYAAYPHLTTPRIRTNAAIRHGLATASTEAEAAGWLVHFGFPRQDAAAPESELPARVPAATVTLQSAEIPALVFGGLRPLPYARSLVLQLRNGPGPAKAWLAQIESDLAYGEEIGSAETTPESGTVVLGLSASGLRRLGVAPATLATFPAAFQQGMAAPWRARALGDVDKNTPDLWSWGGPGNEADAILNVYAGSAEALDRRVEGYRAELNRFGIKVVYEVLLDEIPPRGHPIREPFGFVDGVSQPIVRGSRKAVAGRNEIHVVAPGEMIFGYEDNFGNKPSPSTIAGNDLGRNGTFLVVRQLEQDTAAFTAFLADAAAGLVDDPRVPQGDVDRVEWIAGKIVGRWRDGTSLIRHPHAPGSVSTPGALPDNDFLFGTEDPDGQRCPFGAHIRRVSPRESFKAGSEEQLSIANRHRIFRVGRSYGPQNGSENPGLLFMCVNANIERQFEFVQQTYMLGSSFHGLEDEIDSFARRPGASFARRPGASDVLTIPTEHGPLRLRGLGSFVTVRGGGYFFMPGTRTIRFLIGRS